MVIMTLIRGLSHFLNPLHVYCRMIDIHLSKYRAKKLGILYEKTIFALLKRIIF